ncbi:hypothetical protein JCGZ_18738 [Jatropha curcas]|uniref:K-box domain-containing protein n=1 Tax=Jatropha curcas TaxID=180498 RepID=A0A067K165_JATCU|nr:hypothetical protein JCGZ_18738 [Jatropha curcas]
MYVTSNPINFLPLVHALPSYQPNRKALFLVIGRRNLQQKNIGKFDQPSLEQQLEDGTFTALSKEVAERTLELRHMRGEELQRLSIEQLQELEKSLERGLKRVLETKEAQLIEENERLKQQIMNVPMVRLHLSEPGHSSDSMITNTSSSADPSQDYEGTYTFLRLGLVFYTQFISLQDELFLPSSLGCTIGLFWTIVLKQK